MPATEHAGIGSSSKPGISVAVMAYNEAASLERVVGEIKEELERIGNPHEILIINDGSIDKTGEIADQLSNKQDCVRVLHHPVNLGLGTVYRNGFYESRLDLVTLFPADGQFEPSIISQFLPLFERADLVLGHVPELKASRTLLARFLSWGERLLYRFLFGSFPEFQGILMFRRALLDSIELTSSGRGWMIQMELILRFKRKGYRIMSVPTGIRPRMSGDSKVVNVRSILSNLRQVFALRWRLWTST